MESCQVKSSAEANDGFYQVSVTVGLASSVLSLRTIQQSDRKMEFLEQLATHLVDCSVDSPKDSSQRKFAEMINIMDAMQIELGPEGETSDEKG